MNLSFYGFVGLLLMACPITYLLPKAWRKWMILILSMVFFAVHGILSLLIAAAGVILTFIFGQLIEKYKNRGVLTAGLLSVFSLLLIFKYVNTWVDMGLIVPLGLSYYVLMGAGYMIDIYRGKEKAQDKFMDFSLFMTFFPQVMAGPIGRSTLLKQWKKGVTFHASQVRRGFVMLLIGVFEKILLADNLSRINDAVFFGTQPFYGSMILLGIIAYALQIYFDFAGYSLIAIGGARMLGIELMDNFRAPYFALSIQDFWRRWHISLSSWFRDYLYFPLGGSRVPMLHRDLNLIIVFVASGIWHGTAAGFALWGLMHGIYLVVGKHTEPAREKIRERFHLKGVIYGTFRRVIVFMLAALAFLPFQINDIASLLTVIRHGFWKNTIPYGNLVETLGFKNETLLIMFFGILFIFALDWLGEKVDVFEKIANIPYGFRVMFYVILIVIIVCAGGYGSDYNPANFIYGQF